MKKRISATIDPETDKILDSIVEIGKFRNKSHAIEDLIKAVWEEKYAKQKKK